MGANLEKLTLTGTAAIDGTGNILANTLVGNSGSNTLNGGLGNDTLRGGAGMDTFVFDSILNAATNKDTLADFTVVDDTIRLDKTIFTQLSLGTLNADQFKSLTTGAVVDADDYILYNRASGALMYDADGSGSGAAIQFAILTTKPAINAADFVVVA